MPTINDLVLVGNSFSIGTTYSVGGGSLGAVVDGVTTSYSDIYHGDTLNFGGFSADVTNSRLVELDYYDKHGNLIGDNGSAYHVSFDNGQSYLFVSDSNPYKDLKGIESIEVVLVNTSTTIHTELVSLFDDNDAMGVYCFAAGTPIETQSGASPVEALQVGDVIWTLDRGHQTLRRIFEIPISPVEISRPGFQPILFLPGSLGDQIPEVPIRLSQQHKVLIKGFLPDLYFGVSEVFVKAKHLVNGENIILDTLTPSICYYHLEFDQHEVLDAAGLLSESLFDNAFPASTPQSKAEEFEQYFSDETQDASPRPTLSSIEASVLARSFLPKKCA